MLIRIKKYSYTKNDPMYQVTVGHTLDNGGAVDARLNTNQHITIIVDDDVNLNDISIQAKGISHAIRGLERN